MRKVVHAMSVSLDGFIEAANGDLRWSFPDGGILADSRREPVGASGRDGVCPDLEEQEEDGLFKDSEESWLELSTRQREYRGEVNRLKAQPGKDMSVGGPGIASAFIELGLIDEYCLYVHPIVLGGGKPVFPHLRDSFNLRFVETRTLGSGVVLLKLAKAPREFKSTG